MEVAKYNIRFQILILVAGAVLMAAKFAAYYITLSNAILTDALESIINVIAGIFALYSLVISAKPKDSNHPYGHGKIEFISSSIEGSLILFAGGLMIAKAFFNFMKPIHVSQLDVGIYISVATGLVNYFLGNLSVANGKKHNSTVLLSGGNHLKSDAYSTAGLIVGLAVVHFTSILWLDNVVAIIFGLIISGTGYTIVRNSISGIMDETDYQVVNKIIDILDKERTDTWIDIHNMRVIKFGSMIHVDCHVTVPWYLSVKEGHNEIDEIEAIVAKNSGSTVEMFIHTDPCIPASCRHCLISGCQVRQLPFESKLDWTLENVMPDRKHGLMPDGA